jgi:hypothetical protein
LPLKSPNSGGLPDNSPQNWGARQGGFILKKKNPKRMRALCICPLNPPILGDFRTIPPRIGGLGGRSRYSFVV